jgi:glycine/D-amino acid oxidase-like deaminating enzyme
MTIPRTSDVVVIGSGITGAATAAAVASRGASVVLLDKEDGPAREGSGRAQGSLRLQGRHGAEFPLAQEALKLWAQAAEEGDFELVTGGNLYFHTRPEELPVLRGLVAEAHRAGLTDVQLLDREKTRAVIPAATGPFLGAMWSPVDGHCQPEKGTAHFIARAEKTGAHIQYRVKATGIVERVGRVLGVDTSLGRIETAAVVVAAGAWTPYLAKTVGLKVPIMPVVMSELETNPVQPLFSQTLRAFGFGARQRPNGRVVVSAGLNAKVQHGASLSDFNGLRFWLPRVMSFRKSINLSLDTRRILEQVRRRSILDTSLVPLTSPEPAVDRPLVHSALSRLQTVIPGLREATVGRYWAGLVDMTPDGLPIIDGQSGPQGFSIITGLCGHGFTLGPVLGEIGSDLALDGRTGRRIETFALSRFSHGPVPKPELMI